jgi:hypothetical protein
MNSFSKSYVSGAARGILLQNRIELLWVVIELILIENL